MRTSFRLLAATTVVAAGVLLPAPAQAASCGSADGVTVVVDFNGLGGGVRVACVPDQGTADDLFTAAGHSLSNVQGQAFVCRVDGLPSADDESCTRTPPANAYWGLFWSDGSSGSWSYSSQGAYSLDVPDGGSVGFSWQGSATRSAPSATPPDHDGGGGTSGGTSGGAGGSGGSGGGSGRGAGSGSDGSSTPTATPSPSSPTISAPSGSAPPSAKPRSDRADRNGRADRDDRVTQDGGKADRDRKGRSDGADRDRKPANDEGGDRVGTAVIDEGQRATSDPAVADGGLPAWIAPSVIGALFAAAGVAAWLRRRASASG